VHQAALYHFKADYDNLVIHILIGRAMTKKWTIETKILNLTKAIKWNATKYIINPKESTVKI
jgi:glutathione peroxidase-family protein